MVKDEVVSVGVTVVDIPVESPPIRRECVGSLVVELVCRNPAT